jgi:hypothetical protein
MREQQWRRIATQALWEPPAAVRMVAYVSWDTDNYGQPFGSDEALFEDVEQGNA